MKTISDMAKAAGVNYRQVYDVVLSNKITPVGYDGTKKLYCKLQEDFIYKILYFCRFTNFITFESKINNPNFEEERFLEHKRKTYNKFL